MTPTPPEPDILQRALAAHAQRKFDEAASLCRAMLAQNPGRFDLWHFLAIVEAERGQHLEAVEAYDRSISLQPSDPTAHFNRAKSLQALRRWSEALVSYDAALSMRRDFAPALINRGNALQQLNRFEDAVASYDAALSIQPAFAQALNNRGNALQQLNRVDDAVASYDAALAVEPNYVEAWTNRGHALQRAHRTNEALASYDAAVSIRPDYAEAHFSKAHCKLLTGDFASGWDDYEWRWDTAAQRDSKRTFPQPLWDGQEQIADRTILIHAEQGFGDTIQFCRYVPMLADKGADVILEVQPSLKRLLQGLRGTQAVVARGDPLPEFDFHCPLLSLPRAFATRLATIPAPPRLRIPEESKETWRSRLSPTDSLRVGIMWAGGVGLDNNRSRSIGLSEILALSDLPVSLVSLQKEVSAEDEAELAARNIAHFGAQLTDFQETAALALLMDRIISIDTSVAHLAGTLGQATSILLPFSADLRWLLDRADSPWYPSVRLFRQPAPGDWGRVIAAVRAELIAGLH